MAKQAGGPKGGGDGQRDDDWATVRSVEKNRRGAKTGPAAKQQKAMVLVENLLMSLTDQSMYIYIYM